MNFKEVSLLRRAPQSHDKLDTIIWWVKKKTHLF